MKGFKSPKFNHGFKSRIDGLYYNGYMGSPDAAEDAFGECFRNIAKKIENEIKVYFLNILKFRGTHNG